MFSKTHLKKSAVGLFMAATCMSMSVMPALAADETITTTGNATAPANASIGLSVDKASEFTISVPKKVEISTSTKDATVNYDVKVTGDIPSDSYVTVVPTSDTLTLSDVSGGKKADITGTVSQEAAKLQYDALASESGGIQSGTVSATVTAGKWEGSIGFEAKLGQDGPGLYNATGEQTMTWAELLENTELSVMEDGTLTSDNGIGGSLPSRTNIQALSGKIVIPDSVESIGNYAFYDCTGLTSVTIPDSVTSIGDDAFEGCTGLTSVTISDSVTSIGDSTFRNCTSLTSVTIPDSVTSIRNNAFNGCTGLTSIAIPDSLEKINFCTFCGCTGLTSITIPDSVTSIGDSAFEGCSNLATINFTGTQEQWNAIINLSNAYIPSTATINYNYVEPKE